MIDFDIGRARVETTRRLAADPATVWRFLVEENLRAIWLCAGQVEPREGGTIEFKFDPHRFGQNPPPGTEADRLTAEFEGTVTRYEPHKVLAFSWPGEAEDQQTDVTITLTRDGEETILHLLHENLHRPEHMAGASAGWHAHLERLECHLMRKMSPNFWGRHDALEKRYRNAIG